MTSHIRLIAVIMAVLWACSCFAGTDDSYTKVLLHFDGNLTDESGKTWTGFGNASSSGAQYKFGTGALYLDGNGDYILASSSPDFEFGSGNWTVDFWEYKLDNNNYRTAIARDSQTVKPPWLVGQVVSGNEYLTLTDNSSTYIVNANYFGTVVTNAWSHIAVSYDGSSVRAFRDGVQIATHTAAITLGGNTKDISIGWVQNQTLSQCFYGYIDEVRISKGIARWTANFTPPTEAYGSAPAPSSVTPGALRIGAGGTLYVN